MSVKSFRELKVWQKANKFIIEVQGTRVKVEENNYDRKI